MDEYKTILKESSEKLTERKSVFIGWACPVQTEEQAQQFIAAIKTKHWDATHNVYAYSLREGQLKRYSDDGEPQGTAGIPVLEVLNKSGVTDTVIVVTRYFGGVLLGAGGLVRAYSKSASAAMSAAEVVTMRRQTIAFCRCDYKQLSKITAAIADSGTLNETLYLEDVELRFCFPPERYDSLCEKLREVTCGEISVTCTGSEYYPAK